MVEVKCAICGAGRKISFTKLDKYGAQISYADCRSCGVSTMGGALFNYGEQYAVTSSKAASRLKAEFILRCLFKCNVKINETTRILDFGCGTGEVDQCLKEISDIDIVSFDPYFHPNSDWENIHYDCIILIDVIEHIENPIEVFQKLRSVLKPDGKIIVCTPNLNHWTRKFLRGRWPHFHSEHVVLYTNAGFQKFCSNQGFDFCELPIRKKFSLGYLLSVFSGKSKEINFLFDNVTVKLATGDMVYCLQRR